MLNSICTSASTRGPHIWLLLFLHALALPPPDPLKAFPPPTGTETITAIEVDSTTPPPAPPVNPVHGNVLPGVVSSLRPLVHPAAGILPGSPQGLVPTSTKGCQTTECLIVYPVGVP